MLTDTCTVALAMLVEVPKEHLPDAPAGHLASIVVTSYDEAYTAALLFLDSDMPIEHELQPGWVEVGEQPKIKVLLILV